MGRIERCGVSVFDLMESVVELFDVVFGGVGPAFGIVTTCDD